MEHLRIETETYRLGESRQAINLLDLLSYPRRLAEPQGLQLSRLPRLQSLTFSVSLSSTVESLSHSDPRLAHLILSSLLPSYL